MEKVLSTGSCPRCLVCFAQITKKDAKTHSPSFDRSAGLDLQSQEAYELAAKGLTRTKSDETEFGTVVYGMKCVHFDPPDFSLGEFS